MLLEDILESIQKINEYTEGKNYRDFVETALVSDAVIRNIEIIGEAVKQLPNDFTEKYPDIEWHKISAVRNRIIHEYFGVDLGIIWFIIENDLPVIKVSLKNILSTLS